MSASSDVPAKIVYGVLFVVALPVLLVLWARATEGLVPVTPVHARVAGSGLTVAGGSLMVWAWWALWRYGGGLPMNAFPPPRYVADGPYRVVAHPIYVGFVSVCLGVSIATGSASGLWLVSPAAALGAAALVLGYEAHDLRERFVDFPGSSRPAPFLSLAGARADPPRWVERLSACAIVGLPAVVVAGAIDRTRAGVVAAVALVATASAAARTRADLRALEISALLVTTLLVLLAFASPVVPPASVAWALLAIDAWTTRSGAPWIRRARWMARAAVVFATAAATGNVSGPSAGVLAYAVATHRLVIWSTLRRLAESVANSWREARLGPARVINHGVWGGLATFFCVVIVGTLLGPGHVVVTLVPAFASMVCAALWAQGIEGSPALSRPYGFYGGLLGVCAGGALAPLFGTNTWLLLGAFAVAGPVTQATGRMRCLVQGCCHGSPAPPGVGIRFSHPMSRVCRLANLRDVPIHPTQLYSILWNAVTQVVLLRVWLSHAAAHLVAGLFLLLNGVGRFVEESYRGEPQTPIVGRLRLYQWVAILSAIAGALVTALGASPPAPAPDPSWPALAAALVFGALTWFATGVDFPDSNRRFSRLA
jgi:prolipoprotein diacylglyceryltransferase/protein-S-isoprenylcysteine O-methyltransferase Ste14